MLGKRTCWLASNRNGLKQFEKNLIDAIQELSKVEKPFSDFSQNDTNKLI